VFRATLRKDHTDATQTQLHGKIRKAVAPPTETTTRCSSRGVQPFLGCFVIFQMQGRQHDRHRRKSHGQPRELRGQSHVQKRIQQTGRDGNADQIVPAIESIGRSGNTSTTGKKNKNRYSCVRGSFKLRMQYRCNKDARCNKDKTKMHHLPHGPNEIHPNASKHHSGQIKGHQHVHQFVSDDHHVGRFHRNVRPRPQRDAHVRLGQGGGIVDAVPHHGHHVAQGLQTFDVVGFVRRQHLGEHAVLGNAQRVGHGVGGLGGVAGHHVPV
jgi:hypothetical protein